MNNYFLSSEAYQDSSLFTLFCQPYKEGWNNLKQVVAPELWLGRRIQHVVAGALLLFPLVNTLVMLALRVLFPCTLEADKNLKTEADKGVESVKEEVVEEEEEVEDNDVFMEDVDPSSPEKLDHQIKLVVSEEKLAAYEKVKQWVARDDILAAWSVYVSTIIHSHPLGVIKGVDRFDNTETWPLLPPEKLIREMAKLRLTPDIVLATMPVRLLRDCAIAYPNFRDDLLKNPFLLNCFSGHIDEMMEICESDSRFAYEILTSYRAQKIAYHDEACLKIFKAAYPTLCEALKAEQISSKNFEYLSQCLKTYSSRVRKSFFARIQHLKGVLKKLQSKQQQDPEQQKFYTKALAEIKTVLDQFTLQGVKDPTNSLYIYTP